MIAQDCVTSPQAPRNAGKARGNLPGLRRALEILDRITNQHACHMPTKGVLGKKSWRSQRGFILIIIVIKRTACRIGREGKSGAQGQMRTLGWAQSSADMETETEGRPCEETRRESHVRTQAETGALLP